MQLQHTEDELVSRSRPMGWELALPTRTLDVVLSEELEVVSHGPGADAWLSEPGVLDALQAQVERLGAGWWPLPPIYVRCVQLEGPDGAQHLLSVIAPRPDYLQALQSLTPAQLEVAELAAAGAAVADIARLTGRSGSTVRTHLKAVYAALAVANRVELSHVLRRPAISYGR